MKNRSIMMVVVLSMVLGVASQAAWAGEVARRQDHQQNRIANGIKSGQLTPAEAARLEKGENKIDNAQQKALADGKVTRGERLRMNKMENKESHRINMAKHNLKKA